MLLEYLMVLLKFEMTYPSSPPNVLFGSKKGKFFSASFIQSLCEENNRLEKAKNKERSIRSPIAPTP